MDASFTIEQSLSHAFVVFNLDPIRTKKKKKKGKPSMYFSSPMTIQKLHGKIIQKMLLLERRLLLGEQQTGKGSAGGQQSPRSSRLCGSVLPGLGPQANAWAAQHPPSRYLLERRVPAAVFPRN